MIIIKHLTELLASFIESYILFSIIETNPSNKARKLISCCITTIFITFLNSFTLFSNITQTIDIIISSIIASFIFKIKYEKAITITIFYFILLCICDFTILTSFQLIWGDSIREKIISLSPERILFLVIVKGIEITGYLLYQKFFRFKIRIIPKYYKYLLLCGIINYLCVCFTTDAIISGSLLQIKLSIIIDWLFMLLSIIMLIIIFYWISNQKIKQNQIELIKIRDKIIISNSHKMHELYLNNAHNYHDFYNHLTAIRELIKNRKSEEAISYINNISRPIQEIMHNTWTGDDVIDAILSNKVQESEKYGIRVNISAQIPNNFKVAMDDLCAILSNLFDNAIEACTKVSDPNKRIINIIMNSANNMFILKIENSVCSNPLVKNATLSTTKPNSIEHGWGLKSVIASSEKYGGYIQHMYIDGLFSSILIIPL